MTYASEVTADSPVLWWRLGEASGTTAADSSGAGRAGTYSGGPTLGVTGLISGDSDTAVRLDGVDDYVAYTGTVIASGNDVSVEIWFNGPTSGTGGRLFSLRDGADIRFELRELTASGERRIDGTVASSTTGWVFGSGTPIPIAPGTRHHVVLNYSNSANTGRVYLDGALVASNTSLSGTTISINEVNVGRRSGTTTLLFPDIVDEFAIYPSTLSGTRVAAHYNAGAPPPPITIHPNKITSTGTVHAPAIVPYIPPPADGNITITAELTPATKYAACIEPDRSAQIEPARHVAGVNAT